MEPSERMTAEQCLQHPFFAALNATAAQAKVPQTIPLRSSSSRQRPRSPSQVPTGIPAAASVAAGSPAVSEVMTPVPIASAGALQATRTRESTSPVTPLQVRSLALTQLYLSRWPSVRPLCVHPAHQAVRAEGAHE